MSLQQPLISNTLASKMRQIYKEKITQDIHAMDIITFAESKSGLGLKLYPAQKFILKVFYSLPLDDNLQEPIVIKDQFNQAVLYTFHSEIEFMNLLHAQKRINISYERYLKNIEEGVVINEALLICGRRASKTVLTAIIVTHTLYLLLLIYDPFEFYSLIREDLIGIALVSNYSRSSSRTYTMIQTFIQNSKFFSRFIGGQLGSDFYLKTEAFKQAEEDGVTQTTLGDIVISSYAPNSGLRGAANKVFVIDEIAHFMDADVNTKDKYLDEKVYEAIHPSIFGFTNPDTGRSEGLGFIMSSPNGKKGLLWDFYNESFERNNTVMVNVPSNWININLATDEIIRDYNRSEFAFRQEFLAEFMEQQSNWIPQIERLYACFDQNNTNECMQRDNYTHFAGFDLALSNDNTVLAIGHYQQTRPNVKLADESYYNLLASDNNGYYVIDYVKIWQPTSSGDIQIEALIEELDFIFRRFQVKTGSYDQFSHAIFTQMIQKKPSIKMEMKPVTQAFNSEKAMLTKRLINEGRLIMPEMDFIRDEWKTLQETVAKNGFIKVANDMGHDDTFSAISTCLYHIFTHTGAMKKESIVVAPTIQKQTGVLPRTVVGGQRSRYSRVSTGGRVFKR